MMKRYKNPAREEWNTLCARPSGNNREIEKTVISIMKSVREKGDNALRELSLRYDGVDTNLTVSDKELDMAESLIDPSLKKAIDIAYRNIKAFHSAQSEEVKITETTPGVKCWRKSVPIEKIGLYIPGGTAPLFSTVLMLAIPARLAGCTEIIMCTPPSKDGTINPAILYCAKKCGVTRIFKTGGAQAIAAMAYGTGTIPAVYKIFGPGNQYVTKAKEIVRREGIEIDMPAGPSEVLVIADNVADPEFVAADLLSQAEHGTDSQVILLTESESLTDKVMKALETQLDSLPRKDIADMALKNSIAIEFDTIGRCLEFSNLYAPEHLIINTAEPDLAAVGIKNAGSVFIGPYSCESAGDYASGTNHTLPTGGCARTTGGVSLDSFVKKITFQEITKKGLANLSETIIEMAGAESLKAHANAVSVRIKNGQYERD